MKKILYSTLLASSLFTYSFASTDTKSGLIEEMFKVSGIEKKINGGFDKILPEIEKLALRFRLNTDQKKELIEIYKDWFYNVIDHKKVKQKYKEAYEKSFSEDEIKALIEFFKSPIGKKYKKVSPKLSLEASLIVGEEAKSKQSQLIGKLKPFFKKIKKERNKK